MDFISLVIVSTSPGSISSPTASAGFVMTSSISSFDIGRILNWAVPRYSPKKVDKSGS